jgi:uncharacterized protein YrrD
MTMSNIQLGSAVTSSDGQTIGKVDKVVVDAKSRTLVALILAEDWNRDSDRILALDQIASVDESGHVHTTITLEEAKELKVFLKTTLVTQRSGMPSSMGMFNMEYSHNLEVVTDVDSELLIIERNRDVVDGELEKLGELDEVAFGEGGKITGIVVRTGFIRHHEIPIPLEEIGGVGARYVRVTISKDEFEKRKSQS